MANCADMQQGDIFVCTKCGLELSVVKVCSCESGKAHSCTVPLQCCGQDMAKQ
jgi:hypothetical protein